MKEVKKNKEEEENKGGSHLFIYAIGLVGIAVAGYFAYKRLSIKVFKD